MRSRQTVNFSCFPGASWVALDCQERNDPHTLFGMHREFVGNGDSRRRVGAMVPAREIDQVRKIGSEDAPFPGRILKPHQICHVARQGNEVQFSVAVYIAGDYLVSTSEVIG
jgi:hypothetical protein